jgi:hypothetical protein
MASGTHQPLLRKLLKLIQIWPNLK